MQLHDKADHLRLGGRFISELIAGERPGVFDCPPAIEQTKQVIADRVEAKELIGGRIMEHVGAAAAKMPSMHLDAMSQLHAQ